MKPIGTTNHGYIVEITYDEMEKLRVFAGDEAWKTPFHEIDLMPALNLNAKLGSVTLAVGYAKDALLEFINDKFNFGNGSK